MALDEDGLAAVELLVNAKQCAGWLQAPAKFNNELRGYLNDHGGDAMPPDYNEIIALAHDRVFKAGGAGGAAGATGQIPPSDKKGAQMVRREDWDPGRATAPFRFIDIPDTVLMPEHAVAPRHDVPQDGLFCATIHYELIAETPILIGAPDAKGADTKGSGKPPVEPVRLGANGPYVLPGATVRGMVRAGAEIVGHGKLQRGNWHQHYGVRDFQHRVYMEKSVADVTKVKSGFLHVRKATPADKPEFVTEDNEVFEIEPAAKPWQHVPIASLSAIGLRYPKPGQGPRGNDLHWINVKLADKYRDVGMVDADDRPVFTRTHNFSRTQTIRKDREMSLVASVGEPGMLVFAGDFRGDGTKKTAKKLEYVFFRNPNAQRLPLPKDRVALFVSLHSEPSKNKTVPAGNWKLLLPVAREGGVPVFYVGEPTVAASKDFFFGLTRLFKIPHDQSVGDIIHLTKAGHWPRAEVEERVGGRQTRLKYDDDFVERLFGHVIEPKDLPGQNNSDDPAASALKGRIAFSFAQLDPQTPARVADPVTVIQMAPRASFAPFYLRSDGSNSHEKDWSVGGVTIAGRKAYFPRYTTPDTVGARNAIIAAGNRQVEMVEGKKPGSISQDALSRLKFLMPKDDKLLCFAGQIRMHNVSAAEIGLILFVLSHGGDRNSRFRHMAGRAKPFGAGQLRLGALVLKAEANGTAEADLEKLMPEQGKDSLSLQPFLDAFADHAGKTIKGFPDVPAIEEWLGMADPEQGEKAKNNLKYQPLDSFAAVRNMFKPLSRDSKTPEPLARLLAAPRSKRQR
jgi:CRISPR-associated protein (TIGR03986 family)